MPITLLVVQQDHCVQVNGDSHKLRFNLRRVQYPRKPNKNSLQTHYSVSEPPQFNTTLHQRLHLEPHKMTLEPRKFPSNFSDYRQV